MTNASHYILATLADRGYRITKARRELCAALLRARHPLTVKELAARTKSDEASAYRFVRTLIVEDLVNEIVSRGERSRFEFKDEHHHHVVCTSCGFIEHVPCKYTPHVPHDLHGFAKIEDHDLTFYGRCLGCK